MFHKLIFGGGWLTKLEKINTKQMISIVYSTRQDDPLFTSHLNKTTVGDIEILQYINNGEFSLTELYNKGLDEASGGHIWSVVVTIKVQIRPVVVRSWKGR
jgi:hypothetical protein